MTLRTIRKGLERYRSKEKARVLQSFFKTGPGEYGEKDVFLGVKVPQIRKVAQTSERISIADVSQLLKSKIHEERLLALLILILKFKEGSDIEKKRIYKLYLSHTKYVNNWDLVDLSAAHIVGAFLADKDRKPLYILARSKMLWERRIAIISTFHCIKHNIFGDTFKIAQILLHDKEDLIQKAVGWMLREVGKRNAIAEEDFLKKHYKRMPRTMLRYAIEKFPPSRRQAYLKGKV